MGAESVALGISDRESGGDRKRLPAGARGIYRTALPPRKNKKVFDAELFAIHRAMKSSQSDRRRAEPPFDPVDREYLQEASLAHLARKATEARSRGAREWIRGRVDARRRYRPPRGGRTHQSLQREVFPAPLWPRSDRIVLSRKDQTDPIQRILVAQ